ncbi:hypothetical protein [Chamaesiphon sp. VAR_48_metabat_403]|uniref:hypothetical protein n=1 Tax=Chamaesiphon sp. VAR_48_metabat_403 TaxID=2964700 RepID=UPI00286DD7F3|nr:hypothetical protein [Chamaesiphon sp. VAR_48_metabat_403]
MKCLLPLASLACGLSIAIGACAPQQQAAAVVDTPAPIVQIGQLPEAKLARSQAFTPTDLKPWITAAPRS